MTTTISLGEYLQNFVEKRPTSWLELLSSDLMKYVLPSFLTQDGLICMKLSLKTWREMSEEEFERARIEQAQIDKEEDIWVGYDYDYLDNVEMWVEEDFSVYDEIDWV